MQMICWRDCNWSCSWKKIELVVQICSKLSVLGLKKNNIRIENAIEEVEKRYFCKA